MREPQKRYLIEVAPSMLLIAAWMVLLLTHPGDPGRAKLGLMPLVAMAWLIGAMWRRLLRKDELEQRIELYAIAFAAASTGLGTFAWSLAESAGLVAHGSLMYVMPFLIAAYGFAKCAFRWRYR
jgi:hypothetical protein